MIYTDAHCHIIPNTPSDPTVIGRICNATRESEWANFVENATEENLVCIGIHPWYLNEIQDGWQNRMADILRADPHIMVGEIGLDKYHDDMPQQIQIFSEQMEMAAQFRRPVHLHCVGAWDKILHILKKHSKALPPAILAHEFNGDKDLIERLANEYNMFFSYHAQDSSNDKLMARIVATPQNRLLIESDADTADMQLPILQETVQKISDIWCMASDEACSEIYTNFQRITSYVRSID